MLGVAGVSSASASSTANPEGFGSGAARPSPSPCAPSRFPLPRVKKCCIESLHRVSPFCCRRGITVGLPVPSARNCPTAWGSPTVAERPTRLGFTPASRDRRSTKQRVCPPRSPRRNAWISSITTKRRSPNRKGIAACRWSSMASSDSGVICSMPEGSLANLRFSDCDTSPCQCHTLMPVCLHTSSSRVN